MLRRMDKIILHFEDVPEVKNYIKNFEAIRSRFIRSGVTVENITKLVIALMEEANKIANLPGSQKKLLVTKVIQSIVDELFTEKKDQTLEKVIMEMVPGLIDLFVDVSKGVMLKKVTKCFSFCFKK